MHKSLALMAITGILTLSACSQPETLTCTAPQVVSGSTCVDPTGSVTVNKPATMTVTIYNSAGTVVPESSYSKLPAGSYTAIYSQPGYVSSQPKAFTVAAGQATTITAPTLVAVSPTTGSVSVTLPVGMTVVIADSNGAVVPPSAYGTLAPGKYTATYSQTGFVTSQPQPFTVVAGQSLTLTAPALTPVDSGGNSGKTAYYIDAAGEHVQIKAVDPTRFRFNAWLQDRDGGVTPGNTSIGTVDPSEQSETAPLNHQNIAAAFMEYRGDDGVYRPVVGAQVRWDITSETGGTRFSAADDGSMDSGTIKPLDINSNALSALTWTNLAGNNNVRFPASPVYPLYNMTNVKTPDTTGFTWTALNHDPSSTAAGARIRVIGYVNDVEIEKAWLTKAFAPSAKIEILKEGNQSVLAGESGSFSIKVSNTGQAAATGIVLKDILATGNAANYSITAPTSTGGGTVTAGPTIDGTGFSATLDLPAGSSQTFTFTAKSTAPGIYCDIASIGSYENGPFGMVTPVAGSLSSQACLTVRAPRLNILKAIVDENGNTVATPTIAQGQKVNVRITLVNGGDAPATGVVLADALTTGSAANYTMGTVTPSTGVTAAGGGFTTAAQDIAPGATVTYTFPASASVDGQYCDTASFTSTNAGSGDANACFTVATAKLAMTKTNSVTSVSPGGSYTSTITVTNSGTAAAQNVAITDLLGNSNGNSVLFGSGSYSVTGTAQPGSVSVSGTTVSTAPGTITIPAGGSATLTIVSSVPAGAAPGIYCNTATYTSTNAIPNTGTQNACVVINAYMGLQTQMTDTQDNLKAGLDTSVMAGAMAVEPSSNEGGKANKVTFNLGTSAPNDMTNPGGFSYSNIQFWYDPAPVRDQQTGAITSDYSHTGSTPLAATLSSASGVGMVTATFDPNFVITPGGVIWYRISFAPPASLPAGQRFSTMMWETVGTVDGKTYYGPNSEPTTVIN